VVGDYPTTFSERPAQTPRIFSLMTSPPPTFAAFLRDQYGQLFGRPWPVVSSALMIGALNVFLFAFDRPWTASDGLRNWGDWALSAAGLIDQADLLPPLLYSGSLLNIGVLLGGMAAALLSREFAVRTAPLAELIKGACGGLFMGIGAMLSFGCNIGGFFSALSALSASGIGMMAGLLIGAFIGTRYLIRENAGLIAAGFFYRHLGHQRLATFLVFGLALGAVFQRSRFCLVNAFREPFMTGASEHARAAALALVFSMIGFTILKATDLKDAGEWVFPSFVLGALGGGIVFGIGMVLAGGCGAGSVWRAGEGHVKLWLAVAFFALGASTMRQLLTRSEMIRQLGDAVFLPNAIGWAGAVSGVVVLMAICYLLAGWNEQKRRVGVLQL
jgi:uncharacterized membrane protein YedE/YeeE